MPFWKYLNKMLLLTPFPCIYYLLFLLLLRNGQQFYKTGLKDFLIAKSYLNICKTAELIESCLTHSRLLYTEIKSQFNLLYLGTFNLMAIF